MTPRQTACCRGRCATRGSWPRPVSVVRHPPSIGESSRGAAEARKGGEGCHRDTSSTTTPSTNKAASLFLLSATPRLRVSSSRRLEAAHGQAPLIRARFTRSRGGAEGGKGFNRDFSSTTVPSTNKAASLLLLSAAPRLRVSSSRLSKKPLMAETLSVGEEFTRRRGAAEGGEVFTGISVRRRRDPPRTSRRLSRFSPRPREFFTLSKSAHGRTLSGRKVHAEARSQRKGGEVFHRDFSSTRTRPSTNKSGTAPASLRVSLAAAWSSRCPKTAHGHAADCDQSLVCGTLGIAGVAKSGGYGHRQRPPTPDTAV